MNETRWLDADRLTPYDGHSVTHVNRSLHASRFPDDAHHGWKYIAFGPDGALLNSDDRAGAIYRIAHSP